MLPGWHGGRVKDRTGLTAEGADEMLVLSRQRDETIMIGDDIEITVVDIRGEKVRLGINAPSHVPVHRKEVYEAIKREHATSGNGGTQVESLANRKPKANPDPKPQTTG
jgi:carbon storage regulator